MRGSGISRTATICTGLAGGARALFQPFRDAVADGPGEDWSDQAWEDPWNLQADRRGRFLDEIHAFDSAGAEFALFGDGGFCRHQGATFSSQAREFGQLDEYFLRTGSVSPRLSRRMPARYGHEAVTINVAELAAMLVSLRWRCRGKWNLVVSDRSSLFSRLRRLASGSIRAVHQCACSPLEMRLLAIVEELRAAWRSDTGRPAWRLSMDTYPERWTVRRAAVQPEGEPARWMSQVLFDDFGLVGLHVKSHQDGVPIPFAVIVQGNEAQDQGCAEARQQRSPCDVWLPTGGFFAHITVAGRMVTQSIPVAVRFCMREQAYTEWTSKPVQGRAAAMSARIDREVYLSKFVHCCEGSQCMAAALAATRQNLYRRLVQVAVQGISGHWRLVDRDAAFRPLLH